MDDSISSTSGAQNWTFRGVVNPALQGLRQLLSFFRTSPGRLTLISTLLILVIVSAGGAMVYSAGARQSDLDTLVNRREPLAYAAQELYNNLSLADTVATTAFLQRTSADSDASQVFTEAVSNAASSVIKATAGTDNIESREMELILTIQSILPDYVQLISNALTQDRLQNPVGVSYLNQGSALLQHTMLPAAEELYRSTSQTVSRQQDTLVRPLWFPLSGLLAAVVMLIIIQFWLAALTNRRLNMGYLIATVLMMFATGWAAVSSAAIWNADAHDVRGAVRPLEQLTQVRIGTQGVRTTEALELVQRDYRADTPNDFSAAIIRFDNELEALRGKVPSAKDIDEARELLRSWDTDHAAMITRVRGGDYAGAVDTALRSRASFMALDSRLHGLIQDTRAELRDRLIEGQTVAGRVTVIVLALAITSAICVFFGTRTRLQEYL